MTLKEIKVALVAAHRSEDWELAKVLSQKKEKLKRARKRCCIDCGVPINNIRHDSIRCRMHFIIHRYYSRSVPNSVPL